MTSIPSFPPKCLGKTNTKQSFPYRGRQEGQNPKLVENYTPKMKRGKFQTQGPPRLE